MTHQNEVSTVEIRERLSELINQVAFGKNRLTLTRRSKPLVAIVPLEDLELLEKLEDNFDLLMATSELETYQKERAKAAPWEKVKKKAGLIK